MSIIQQIPTDLAALLTPARIDPTPFSRPLAASRVSAGFTSPAQDYIESSLDLNELIVHNQPATFFYRVKGDSLKGVGIWDSDLVAVDRSLEAFHRDVILAHIWGEETLKLLYNKDGIIELRPANPAYQPMPVTIESGLQIVGVVTWCLKDIHVRTRRRK